MTGTCVIVPVRDGEPALGAAETLAEALENTADTTVVLIGRGCVDAHRALAETGFADVAMRLCEIGAFAPARWTAVLAGLVDGAEAIMLPASVDGRDLAPRLAAALGRRYVAGATRIGPTLVHIARASGRAVLEIPVDGPVVVTMQPGVRVAHRSAVGDPIEPEVVTGFDGHDAVDARVLEVLPADATTMDLAEAPFILGAGMGLGTAGAVDEMGAVADALDASVGATRVITDEGWIPHDRQIGTTGVVVDPDVYIAFGVSGAVQHTSGLGAPDHVISVNTDPHCPMMQMADLAIVADAPAVVTELLRRLGARAPEEEPRP